MIRLEARMNGTELSLEADELIGGDEVQTYLAAWHMAVERMLAVPADLAEAPTVVCNDAGEAVRVTVKEPAADTSHARDEAWKVAQELRRMATEAPHSGWSTP